MPNIAHPYNVMALKNILLNRRLSRYLLTGIISLLITLASEARAESLIQPEPPDFVAPQLSAMKDCVAARGVKLPDFGDKNPHLTATQTEVVKTCAQESGFTAAAPEPASQSGPPDFVAAQLSAMKDCVAARGVKLPDFGDKNPHLTAAQREVVKTCAQESGFTGSASPMPPKLLPQLPPPQQPLQLPPILTLQ